MNRMILKIWILNLLLSFSITAGAEDYFSLHMNKHYFLVNENIYFSFQASSASTIPEGLPLYAILLQINKDHQHLFKAVKLPWDGHQTHGYIPIPDNIQSGNYLIGIFTEHGLNHQIPFQFAYVYIFNPVESEVMITDSDLKLNTDTDQQEISREDSYDNVSNEDFKVLYEIKHDREDKLYTFYGRIQSAKEHMTPYHLSASVIDKRFYDSSQQDFINKASKIALYDYLKIWERELAQNTDSILNEAKYIHGRLRINDQPANFRKVYFYAQKDSLKILQFYITDQNGNYKFEEPAFNGSYSIKFFTVPEENNTYSFQLYSRLYSDSIYHLNIPDYTLENTEVFLLYAKKKYLIDQSYVSVSEIPSEHISGQYPLIMDHSHEIILDNYIHFPTLPEIIREIVPLVGIRYKKGGAYQIRVYDSRVKDFCCKGNPLIFLNNDPYPDNAEIMNINTNDIYSIEVVRPVEAITQFGDIGINGILKINLHPGISTPSIVSNAVADFQMAGYLVEQMTVTPEFIDNYPDFRSFLFWEGDIRSDLNGEFKFQFCRSRLATDFKIIIIGSGVNGQIIFKEIDLNPQSVE